MHPLLNIAIKAARSAGKIIVRSLDHLDSLSIDEKGHNDFVTEIDKAAEAEIMRIVREAYPNHAFLGEESGVSGESDYVWVIDPLDGTTNFIHGFPSFAVSIGIKVKNQIQHGVIFDPLTGELFHGSRGEGAYLNNRRIRVTQKTSLDGTLLGTGFPYRQPELFNRQLAILNDLFTDVAGFRCIGSAALALAYVAAGRLDGAWIACLSEWDMAAGILLIKEAGGLTSDFSGSEDFKDGTFIGGNPKIFKALLKRITTVIQAQA